MEKQGSAADFTLYKASVAEVDEVECQGQQTPNFFCYDVEVELDEGPEEGERATFQFSRGGGSRPLKEGDRILMTRVPDVPSDLRYQFADYQRAAPLLLLGILFAVFVLVMSRWQGVAALAGLAVSILLLVRFVLPAILQGESPLLVSITGASAIMFLALYLAHGVNVRTTSAVLGTMASLVLTAVLGGIFVEAARFTGLASEEATFLQVSAGEINLQGLLLGGIVIGALGVLDDVTVTQASAVWELYGANPEIGLRNLYRSALRIGRDHITSTVNTLVLAYAGASLPLLILFTLSNRTVSSILTSEVVANEIVRTLVGSIGLVSSVPITTFLAAFAVTSTRRGAARHSAA